jgi:trk system potassium uptake protein TrkA
LSADTTALVVGLGRFGHALAGELTSLGMSVFAIDLEPARVRACADDLWRVAEADATDPEVLHQIGAADMDIAVVSIGESVEASVLAAYELLRLEGPRVLAKARTESHAEILARIGVERVIFPERDMGRRTAHTLVGSTVEYLELDPDYVLAEMAVPAPLVGKTLVEAQVRSRHRVSVVAVKHGERFTHALPDTVLGADDLIVIAGGVRDVTRFAELG